MIDSNKGDQYGVTVELQRSIAESHEKISYMELINTLKREPRRTKALGCLQLLGDV